MVTPTLLEESVAQHGFYVPQCEVRIAGVGLPRDVLRDVSEVSYQDDLKKIDGFSLTVNNWDPATRRYKYIGSETAADLKSSTQESQRYRLFDPSDRDVEVRFGYLGDLHLMVKGTFTTMEPTFPSGGKPTLEVRGVNVLQKLRRKQYSDHWVDKRDSEIAKDIGQKVDRTLGHNARRFPLRVVVSDSALQSETSLPYVAQTNQYDIDFLLIRARRLGYVVAIREADASSRNPDERETHLYFGPSDGRTPNSQDPVYRLKWGASLESFKPTLTTVNQVKSVTVTGWDRVKKQPISVKVSIDQISLNPDLRGMVEAGDPREEIVVDKPVHSKAEAKALATAILKDRYKEMVKASFGCVGLPKLRAGCKVQVEGVGARLGGSYFVTDTTHTFGDGGYKTTFNARREATGLLKGLQ